MAWLERYEPYHVAHVAFRLFQMCGALLAFAFYLTDLTATTKAMRFNYELWLYASVVPITSMVVAMAYGAPKTTKIKYLFAVDAVIFINWGVISAMFIKMFMTEAQAPPTTDRLSKMYLAMWCDVANGGLWFISAVGMFIYWNKYQKLRKAPLQEDDDEDEPEQVQYQQQAQYQQRPQY